MGQSWLLLFILDGLSSQFKNIDDVLGDWTRGFKMVGAKGSTEPWWLSQSKIILLRLLLFEWWQDLTILKRCLFIYIMQRQLVVSNCLNCQNEFVVAHSYEREHIPAAKINSAAKKTLYCILGSEFCDKILIRIRNKQICTISHIGQM